VASRLRTSALGLVLAASLAGCVSIPSNGPVQSSTITQGTGGQGQHYLQIVPKPPVKDWRPDQIVQGFLLAAASFGYWQTAREYLTPTAKWNPSWSAIVYSKGPTVSGPTYSKTTKKGPPDTAMVTVGGKVQATLSQTGGYAVPASPSAAAPQLPQYFKLEKVGGQWRISSWPPYLLLGSYQFNSDYQLRNLYFFDPTYSYLVPDPAYVPLQATPVDLVKGLVHDLIHPPPDWLSHGTATAFQGTSLSDVTLNSPTATVNLSIAASKGPQSKASQNLATKQLQRISAQLLTTLIGSGQSGSAVQSVELETNGNPWNPPGSQDNPVQHLGQARYSPPTGSSGTFYYLDDGYLMERNTNQGTSAKIAYGGKGFSQIAVSPGSPGSQYVAALSGGTLYAGPLGGRLKKLRGGPYETMSWDPGGDLWVTTNAQIYTLPAPDTPGQPLMQPVAVTVVNSDGMPNPGQFNALRVAPDGVRVAIIVNGSALDFGAIVYPQSTGTRGNSGVVKIMLSPFSVATTGITMFAGVNWYGADNVITLSEPGAALTEYPVNGGNSTSIPSQASIQSITASSGSPLIAEVTEGGGGLMTDTSLTGAWPQAPTIKKGISPVYPG
jgi:Lipoprotein LpqB beta-propeller domain/Sporulation and spore germination